MSRKDNIKARRELRARNVDRSKLEVPEGEIDDFRRPDHPDFMTASELGKARWSGLRHNSITNNVEIWVDGVLKANITPDEVRLDGLAVNKAYQEIFQLPHVLPDTPECRDWGAHLDNKVVEVIDLMMKREAANESKKVLDTQAATDTNQGHQSVDSSDS